MSLPSVVMSFMNFVAWHVSGWQSVRTLGNVVAEVLIPCGLPLLCSRAAWRAPLQSASWGEQRPALGVHAVDLWRGGLLSKAAAVRVESLFWQVSVLLLHAASSHKEPCAKRSCPSWNHMLSEAVHQDIRADACRMRMLMHVC